MASQGTTSNSRLAEMQLKFQKKQMLEREQKKLAMTGGNISQVTKSVIGNGKVRQMFDDRRRGVGIDRSHPLRPISTSTISSNLTVGTSTQQSNDKKRIFCETNNSKRQGITNSLLRKSSISNTRNTENHNQTNNVFNNNLDELDNIDNETFPKEFSSLSLHNSHIIDCKNGSDFDNNGNNATVTLDKTILISRKIDPKSKKLNPVITKKSPITTAKADNKSPSSANRPATLSKITASSNKLTLQKEAIPTATSKINKITNKKNINGKPATFVLSVKPPPRISTPPPGMASCQYCQRHFNEDRLGKHEDVCKKMTSKKRKIFDASKHRVKGTEAEKYLKKGKAITTVSSKPISNVIKTMQSSETNSGEKKNNWRKKHEEFIAAIREAKKVQAYLAKGGKLSDLPPPPPSENPDYIQCPHCNRRFNESAAERHIPKCANMQHNKPKPPKKRF
ncbi:uncharacterized protein ACRADG_001554 isoform 1-T3 [Cochliomyia hominivorax]